MVLEPALPTNSGSGTGTSSHIMVFEPEFLAFIMVLEHVPTYLILRIVG
jgi:hypothetical protein